MAIDVCDVVIVGSGPAGWTAALYAARANLKPLVFEGAAPNQPGGQLMITSEVENFPGFPKGIMGPELMELFKKQAERFGAIVKTENIAKIDFSKRPYKLWTEEGQEIAARTVIIATGANAKLLSIPKEKELMATGAGVSACATCDGAFYKNVDVAVVGGGDTAMEEANFLTRFAKSVTIIHRREEFRASAIMLERARSNPKIRFELNYEVDSLLVSENPHTKREALSAVRLKSTKGQAEKTLSVEGLFVAIGHKPNSDLFKKVLPLSETGYIKTLGQSSKTELPGIFACGDVQDSVYRQAVTAAGTGCMAAIDAERFLEQEGH